MSQYIINDGTSFSNKRNTPDPCNSDTSTEDRPQLLTWLSPLDPALRHWDIQERRVNDVGEWLLETKNFRRWCGLGREGDGESAVLFCYGDPGVGKTFICSLVVDKLCNQASGRNTAVSCFYLDFAARKDQCATNVLGSLLKQIVSGMKTIPKEILQTFQQQKTTIGGHRPQLVDIVRMLQLVTSNQPTFMCLDALDECDRVQRARLLDSLKQILEKSPRTRIFATGRPHILAEIEKRLAGHVASVSGSPNRVDITRFLRVKLGEDDMLDAMDDGLEADILEKIPENMSEMFRLVSLSIEAILRESTIHRRRERLSKMADGLGWGGAYGTTIERIMVSDGDRSRLGVETLMWITHAERPLKVDELCHALAVELGSKDFNAGNAPSILTLMSCCQGLISVDSETSTVRLLHPTLREYLLARPDIFSRPHAGMAEICLTYLNSEQVKALSGDSGHGPFDAPFLNYSSQYWGVHAKRETSNTIKSLALELLLEYDGHISSKLLLEQVEHQVGMSFDGDFGSDFGSDFGGYGSSSFGGLHCASFFGIVDVVAALIEMGSYNTNERDTRGSTPLAWAARNGHEEVVKMLLRRREVYTNQSNYFGQTPLSCAAFKGYGGVVKMLLEQPDVYPDEPDDCGETPLIYAAMAGHEEVVKMLLLLGGASPDKPNRCGQTPLSCAAQSGREGVVKMLLEQEEVNPDKPDNGGSTPLCAAAFSGHEEIVKILLERKEVNPDKSDNKGVTPLSYAISFGGEGVVKTLLDWKEVNPDKPENMGKTPLSGAAKASSRCMGIVRMLLDRKEVNPDKPDNYGQTPLSHAASSGYEQMVKILLSREEVSPDKPDNDGRTPLSHAASRDHEGVVEMLLEREEVTPDKPDHDGRTPLLYAARNGCTGVVKLLLKRGEVNPNKPDNLGQTPLMAAPRWGSQELLKLLESHEDGTPARLKA